jgi:PAS domain-containing protein
MVKSVVGHDPADPRRAHGAPVAALKSLMGSHRCATPLASELGDLAALTEALQLHSGSELLELASDFAFAVDTNWRFTYLNRKTREEFAEGRSLLQKSLWEEFPRLVGTPLERQYREAMATRRHAFFEFYDDPTAAWFEVNISPLSSGGLAIWFRNINHRKKSDEELRRAEERYRLAASAATDLVLDWNLETGEVVAHKAQHARFGFGDGVVKSLECCISLIHPDDRERVSAEIVRCLETGERLICECRIQMSDGEYADI